MAPIVIDARDAAATELRGWGRYARELVARAARGRRRTGCDLVPVLRGRRRARRSLFEQVGLPLAAAPAPGGAGPRAQLLSAAGAAVSRAW